MLRRRRLPSSVRAVLAGLGAWLSVGAVLAGAAVLAGPAGAAVVPGAPIDGPSPDLIALGGAALAADHGGAVAYLRRDGGAPHVFVALLTDGAWGVPVRVDPGLAGPAAEPVVAAAPGGRVAVAFRSGAGLYATVRLGRRAGFTAPQPIAPAAGDPALSMGLSGTAYLAYSDPAGEVRAARLDRTASQFVGLPDALDAQPGGAPGAGPLKRPRVAVAADATGLVVWGEDGGDGLTHVLARRVYGLHVGSIVNDVGADQLGGQAGGSADTPDVGIQDDSSYAWIAMRQAFGPAERAVVRPLVGSQLGALQPIDGGGGGAGAPSLDIDGFGDGLAATATVGGGGSGGGGGGGATIVGSALAAGGFGPGQAVDALAAAPAPAPVAAATHAGQGLVAYAAAQGTLQGRLFDRGVPAGEASLSRPELGAVFGAGGLSISADRGGDVIVAFLQGAPGALGLSVAAVAAPPGPLAGLTTDRFLADARPLLRWTASRPGFAPVSYVVRVDGRPVATTAATSLRLAAPLSDGVHQWQVIATDGLGQQTPAAVRALRIAARPPPVSLALTGALRAGAPIGFTVVARATAGVAVVVVDYGDGTRAAGARSLHRYRRPGRYAVRVTVIDRVGHRAVLRRALAIG